MKPFAFTCIITFCFLFVFDFVIGQSSDIRVIPGSNEYELSIDPLPVLIKEDANKLPFYSIFWIFSNGNYIHSKPVPNPATVSQPPLIYEPSPNANIDAIYAYLTEYYTNDRPPPPVNPFNGTGMDIKPPKNDNDRIPDHPFTGTATLSNCVLPEELGNLYMESSVDSVVPGRKIIFAISYKLSSPAGKLHFFYNAKQIGGQGTNLTLTPSLGAFTIDTIIKPDYSLGSLNTSYNFKTEMEGDFDHFNDAITYDISPVVTSSGAIQEGRLFIVLEANASLNVLDNFVFFAAITEDGINLNNYQARCDQHLLVNPLGLSTTDSLIPLHNGSINNYSNLSGFHYQAYGVSKTHDPNHLCITNVCEHRKEKDKYEAEYTLKFCNADSSKASDAARSAVLTFWDEKGLFENFKLTKVSEGGPDTSDPSNFPNDPKVIKELKLSGLNLEVARAGLLDGENCATIQFTVDLKNKAAEYIYECDSLFLLEVGVALGGSTEVDTARLEEGCYRCYIDSVGVEIPQSLDIPITYTPVKKIKEQFLRGDGRYKKCRRKKKRCFLCKTFPKNDADQDLVNWWKKPDALIFEAALIATIIAFL